LNQTRKSQIESNVELKLNIDTHRLINYFSLFMELAHIVLKFVLAVFGPAFEYEAGFKT